MSAHRGALQKGWSGRSSGEGFLPSSQVVSAARIAMLLAVLIAPYLLWRTPPARTWAAGVVIAGTFILSLTLYVLSRQLTQRRHAVITAAASALLFAAIALTGGVASRLTPLYVVLIIVVTDLSGLGYGIATAVGTVFLQLLTLYLSEPLAGGKNLPLSLAMLYVHAVTISVAVIAGIYIWRRNRFLLAQAESMYSLATALHQEESTQEILRVLVASTANVMDAEAVVLYTRGGGDAKASPPRVIAAQGDWSPTLDEASSADTTEVRLRVDDNIYFLAVRRPKQHHPAVIKATTLHFQLALTRANRQETTTAELQHWFGEAQRAQIETLEALVGMLEARDPFTAGHSRRVATYAKRLADRLGLEPNAVDAVRRAAFLHDIGKVGLPDGILRKAGALTAGEWREVRKHPVTGADLIANVSGLEPLVAAVRGHHERWDGQGYPDGLAGEGIPLAARILSVVDAFDAITTTRSYREAKTTGEAVAILRDGAGTQWCPTCVQAMVDMLSDEDVPVGSLTDAVTDFPLN